MTRTISLHAHDVPENVWLSIVADVEAAVHKAREATSEAAVGGNVYDSHAEPRNRQL